MLYKQQGFVIRQTNYSESSKIITMLNEQGVQVPMMARGFNKPNNAFQTLKQGINETLFTYSKHKGMGTLTEVEPIHNYKAINKDFDLYYYASYIQEVVIRGMEGGLESKGFYVLLKKGFDLLEAGGERNAVLSFILIKMMKFYGVELQAEYCEICGETDYKLFDRYSYEHHGIICTNCFNELEHLRTVPVSNKILYFAQLFKKTKILQMNSVKMSQENGENLRRFIEHLYDEYTGVFFKSRKLIETGHSEGTE
ncbi:DNA repair protein RecO [Aliicoccus persicus]|uniref:DNA repair protein RecO n=1 Tax=Aliicoccus persicus TaxID=930138 RepID=A0A662Z3I1_9STAP|nr:DNA repair protein RecO [Aliicoccus persicus]SEV85026.1 DNA replication and repair protein RecO [Aliicoccus persicus]